MEDYDWERGTKSEDILNQVVHTASEKITENDCSNYFKNIEKYATMS